MIVRIDCNGAFQQNLMHVYYLNGANVVITMAGHNSLGQVLQLREKSLVVPRSGPSAEQQMRARLFGERGHANVIYPWELSPKKMAGN